MANNTVIVTGNEYQPESFGGNLSCFLFLHSYLKKHDNGGHVEFDPKTLMIDKREFNIITDWTNFYGDATEELPPKMPEPQGKPVCVSCFVDANHARLGTQLSGNPILQVF